MIDDFRAIGEMRGGRGTIVLGENMFQFHFVYDKSHKNWPGIEPGRHQSEAELWNDSHLLQLYVSV
jgi:hypothetical protein